MREYKWRAYWRNVERARHCAFMMSRTCLVKRPKQRGLASSKAGTLNT